MGAEDDFDIKAGAIGDAGAAGAGRTGSRSARSGGEGPWRGGPRPRARGGSRGRAAARAIVRLSPPRQVVVKVKIGRGGSKGARLMGRHLDYLRRDGVDREGGAGRAFDRAGEAEVRAFQIRSQDDPRHFRIVVSPRDAAELADLRALTRDLMDQAERDLAARLDWIAVEHWNTAHPHVHVILRGRDEQGGDLVISREYLGRGLRGRAEALVSLELGPRLTRDLGRDLARDIAQDRDLDRAPERTQDLAQARSQARALDRGQDRPHDGPLDRPEDLRRERGLERGLGVGRGPARVSVEESGQKASDDLFPGGRGGRSFRRGGLR